MYTASITHFDGTPGLLSLDATSDESAVAEVRQIVRDGYRNGTQVRTTLSDGRSYVCGNEHGEPVGNYVDNNNAAFAHLV